MDIVDEKMRRATDQLSDGGQRVVVLVLGMHRSGTSALTRVLSLLGADLPSTLVGANDSNQTGHWESRPVCELNDEVLASLGTSWREWTAIDPEWLSSPKAVEFSARAKAVVESEFNGSHLFVLKDPRISRLLPFWRLVFQDVGLALRVVFCVRHPAEVAQSLKARDGFDFSFGHLLWLRNNLDAERLSRGVVRTLVTYQDFLNDWSSSVSRISKDLGVVMPRSVRSAAHDVEEFLRPGLRHHSYKSGRLTDTPANKWFGEVWEILSGAEAGELDAEDFLRLDGISAEMAAVEPAFSHLVALSEYRRNETLRSKSNAEKASKELQETLERLAALESGSDKVAQEVSALKAELQAEREASAELRRQMSLLESEAGSRRTELAEVTSLLATTEEALSKAEAVAAEKSRQQLQEIADLQKQVKAEIEAAKAMEMARTEAQRQAQIAAEQLEYSRREIQQQQQQTEEFRARTAEQAIKSVSQLERLYATTSKKLDVRSSELSLLTTRLLQIETKYHAAGRRADALSVQLSEIATLAQLRDREIATLKAERKDLKRAVARKEWGVLGKLRAMLGPRAVATTPVDFDPWWYASYYGDVQASGLSPAAHFEKIGKAEGRMWNGKSAAASSET